MELKIIYKGEEKKKKKKGGPYKSLSDFLSEYKEKQKK